MLVPFSESPRVALACVSLGRSAHLQACLDSLANHQSNHEFAVVWIENSLGNNMSEPVASSSFKVPEGIHTIHPDTNLGWAGGLHRARAQVDAEYLVWVQDDMAVLDGWLDALVDAADERPEFAAFGSVAVDSNGRPNGFAGGWARPAFDVAAWNVSDETRQLLPDGVTEFDWVTSKGMLTRSSGWDDTGGPDPRLFPLNHVDKDYCTHLRAHGHRVALVPTARLSHLGSVSAPSRFRDFVADWQEPTFNSRWGPVVTALATRKGPVEHDCATWKDFRPATGALDAVELAIGKEAASMLVPFARWVTHVNATEAHGRLSSTVALENQRIEQAFVTSTSWKLTAPLRRIGSLFRPFRQKPQ